MMYCKYFFQIVVQTVLSYNGWCQLQTQTSHEKPNVVIILSDDQAWDDYSMFKHKYIQTPNIDKLAQSGILFKQGYVPTALCCPSLMTVITGQYAHVTGVTGNDPLNKSNKDRATLISYV